MQAQAVEHLDLRVAMSVIVGRRVEFPGQAAVAVGRIRCGDGVRTGINASYALDVRQGGERLGQGCVGCLDDERVVPFAFVHHAQPFGLDAVDVCRRQRQVVFVHFQAQAFPAVNGFLRKKLFGMLDGVGRTFFVGQVNAELVERCVEMDITPGASRARSEDEQ